MHHATESSAFAGFCLCFSVYVTFRGSVNLRNWIVDFFFPKKSVFKNYTGVKVHSGELKSDMAIATHRAGCLK